MPHQEISRSGTRRLRDAFQAQRIALPSHAALSGRREREGCDPNGDAGFQPKYRTSWRVTEAAGAASRRRVALPGPAATAQRRRRAEAITAKQGHRGLVPSPAPQQAAPRPPRYICG